jgi:hypothetical protein
MVENTNKLSQDNWLGSLSVEYILGYISRADELNRKDIQEIINCIVKEARANGYQIEQDSKHIVSYGPSGSGMTSSILKELHGDIDKKGIIHY